MLSSPDGAAGGLCWSKLSARGAQEHPIESMFAQLITTNHYQWFAIYPFHQPFSSSNRGNYCPFGFVHVPWQSFTLEKGTQTYKVPRLTQ